MCTCVVPPLPAPRKPYTGHRQYRCTSPPHHAVSRAKYIIFRIQAKERAWVSDTWKVDRRERKKDIRVRKPLRLKE